MDEWWVRCMDGVMMTMMICDDDDDDETQMRIMSIMIGDDR